MSRLPIRIVKVGGSLFDLLDLAKLVRGWVEKQMPAHHVLVAGGGPLVEKVRIWNELHPLDDETAHWICVDLMSVTARMLHDLLRETSLISDDRELCQRIEDAGCSVFDPAHWLRFSEPKLPGRTLPASWEVTSDAIAGRLAIVLGADELVLMKSSLPAEHNDLERLAEVGYVDAMLPKLSTALPAVRLVDLRNYGSLLVSGSRD